MTGLRRWLLGVLVALDQLANALCLGDPDETISSRAHKARAAGRAWGCILCGLLDRLDPDHCARSAEWDEGERPPPDPAPLS